MTSSSGPMPNHLSIMMVPDVQELTPNAAFTPVSFITSPSKAFTFGPVVIHPELSESMTSFFTLSSI